MTEDVVGYKSDLKHTSTAKARAEDREKKAIEGLRVVEDELRVVKEEFQLAREELCTKVASLDWALREASKAESSVEGLAEECSVLRGDLLRRGAMVGHRDGVITELKDEACTLWASGWLAYNAELSRLFRVWTSIFQFLILMKRRRKNLFLRTRRIPGCPLIPPSLFLFLVKLRFLPGLALPSLHLGLRLLTCTTWRLSLLRLLVAPPQTFRPLCIIFAHFG